MEGEEMKSFRRCAVRAFCRFRYFWRRGYDRFISHDLFCGLFILSALGVLFFIFGSLLGEVWYFSYFGYAFVCASLFLAVFSFSLPVFLSLLFFPVLYLLFICFVCRMFVFLGL
jgi:hypothetical protein